MTNNEIKLGEIIRQNGMVEVLEQFGFEEDKDFIFLRNGPISYILTDGDRPLYAIKIHSGSERPMQFRQGAQTVEIPVTSEYDMNRAGAVDKDGKYKYGITSGNNGVGAVYIPSQGMIICPNYDIKEIMEEQFGFKDTNFGVPLSNGEMFQDRNLQNKWVFVKNQNKINRSMEKKLSKEELEQKHKEQTKKIETVTRKLEKQVKVDKMPIWAQQQLQNEQNG